MEEERTYDVTVFGATGFTGRLAAEYLAGRMSGRTGRLAIAGRHAAKLDAVKQELGSRVAGAASLGVVLADVSDPASLEKLAAETRVVLTTVGPYLRYGEGLVRACARAGTHYVDLTGEGSFADRCLERYDADARASGSRIVHACGFDSIPADVGARFAVGELPAGEPVEIAAYVESGGEHPDWRGSWHSISGGTWHSAIGFMTTSEFSRARASLARISAGAPAGRSVAPLPERVHRAPGEVGGWALPMPTIDREVVLRSAAGDPRYGPRFRYGHHLRVGSLAGVAAAGIGATALFALAQLPPTRRFLLSLKQPGEGPSPEERARNRFCVSLVGTTPGARVVAQVRGGDPGYGDTAKMVGEAALCLAEDGERLPDRAGVLTPMLAMGDALLPRLRAAGIVVEAVATTGRG
jgi:saccharopine dehydrogenase (NAD+, L-glutamate forming)